MLCAQKLPRATGSKLAFEAAIVSGALGFTLYRLTANLLCAVCINLTQDFPPFHLAFCLSNDVENTNKVFSDVLSAFLTNNA